MQGLILPLLVGVFVAAAGSLLGVFAILKRMALVGDALSHVALPGIAIALLLKINPLFGALAFLLFAILGIWILEYKSTLSVETLVGIFFTSSLALGALLVPEPELLEALLGNLSKLTFADAWISIILSVVLIILLLLMHKKLALHMVSQEMAEAIGIKSKQTELIFLLLFALGVALGIKFVGALLMGALIIIPAASAKNIAHSLRGFMALSVIFGSISAALGIYLSSLYNFTPGPIFILSGTAIFILSLLWRKFFRH